MKVKRNRIEANFEPRMDPWYASHKAVVWA